MAQFTREADGDLPSKVQSPFIAMDEITVDPNGVIKQFDRLNIHYASEPDGLNARVLKACRTEIGPVLAYIYNASLAQEGSVPDDWRQEHVAPICKKRGKYDPANYRLLSLTCVCCKTLKHIIVSNINRHLASESIRGARWLSGRVSDSGARGPGFETYRRRVVSLSKTLYSPKVLVNYPESDGSVPT